MAWCPFTLSKNRMLAAVLPVFCLAKGSGVSLCLEYHCVGVTVEYHCSVPLHQSARPFLAK